MTRLPGALGRLQDTIAQPAAQAAQALPATVDGGYGRVPGARIDTTRPVPEPRRLSPAQARQLMDAEMLAAMRSVVESSTELAARLGRRGAVNSVLEVWAGVFPASTTIVRSYEVAIGSILITNLSAAGVVTVASGSAAGDTGGQTGGVGVQYVRPNSTLAMAVGDRSVLLTGTAADKIAFQAFTGMQAFGVAG